MQQNTYDEETKRRTAEEALEYCRENGVSLRTWATDNGHDVRTVRKWVSKYFPEETMKYCAPKNPKASEPRVEPAGFVRVAESQPAGASGPGFRVSYHGAEIETDAQGLDTVLRTVLALSRSGR